MNLLGVLKNNELSEVMYLITNIYVTFPIKSNNRLLYLFKLSFNFV